jgi:hypothetical protein
MATSGEEWDRLNAEFRIVLGRAVAETFSWRFNGAVSLAVRSRANMTHVTNLLLTSLAKMRAPWAELKQQVPDNVRQFMLLKFFGVLAVSSPEEVASGVTGMTLNNEQRLPSTLLLERLNVLHSLGLDCSTETPELAQCIAECVNDAAQNTNDEDLRDRITQVCGAISLPSPRAIDGTSLAEGLSSPSASVNALNV